MEWFTCYKLRRVLLSAAQLTNFIQRCLIVPLLRQCFTARTILNPCVIWREFLADEKNPIAQISLPTTVSETVCLQAPVVDDSVSLNLMPLVQTGEWAISAFNGFCTAAGDIELCQLLAGGALAYPVARWLESSHETAVIAARQNYVKRFYSRYWYNAEQTFLPQCWLDCFQDRYFAEREKRREATLAEGYENFQLTRIAMGW